MSPSWRRSKKPRDEPLQVGEQLDAQVQHEPFADPGGEVLVDPGHGALDDGDCEVERGDQREKPEIVRGQHVVDEYLVQIDARRAERRNGAGEQQAQHHSPAEVACVGPETAEDGAQRDGGGLLDEAVVLVVRLVVGQVLRWRRRRRRSSLSSSLNCGKPRP